MTVNYVKYPVGNKQFVIEWIMPADAMEETEGTPFEAVDCELISISGNVPTGLEAFIKISNTNNPGDGRSAFSISDVFFSPPIANDNPVLPATSRWIWPDLGTGSGTIHVAVLFREI
jgi:hypothetical protein